MFWSFLFEKEIFLENLPVFLQSLKRQANCLQDQVFLHTRPLKDSRALEYTCCCYGCLGSDDSLSCLAWSTVGWVPLNLMCSVIQALCKYPYKGKVTLLLSKVSALALSAPVSHPLPPFLGAHPLKIWCLWSSVIWARWLLWERDHLGIQNNVNFDKWTFCPRPRVPSMLCIFLT